MDRKWTHARRALALALGVALLVPLLVLGAHAPAAAEGATPVPTAAGGQPITYTVQAGDTLGKLALRYGVTVQGLVDANAIENPDLIWVGQVLTIEMPSGWVPSVPAEEAPATPSVPGGEAPAGGPLAFTWSLVDWRPADPDYVATIAVVPQGGVPPYTVYHDGLPQPGATFEIAWRRCQPKPGSVGVSDAAGATVSEDYWLLAPYCPVGVEIVEPEEGAQLKHFPRHFNLTWVHTIDPPPDAYGIEIEVWEGGGWRPWQEYVHERGDRARFFVPDAFPGDLAGRVRMWGIYGKRESPAKTPWRTFEFRVTY